MMMMMMMMNTCTDSDISQVVLCIKSCKLRHSLGGDL